MAIRKTLAPTLANTNLEANFNAFLLLRDGDKLAIKKDRNGNPLLIIHKSGIFQDVKRKFSFFSKKNISEISKHLVQLILDANKHNLIDHENIKSLQGAIITLQSTYTRDSKHSDASLLFPVHAAVNKLFMRIIRPV